MEQYAMPILPLQHDLHPALPNIFPHADYQEFREMLIKIDEILRKSGLESQLVDQAFDQWIKEHPQTKIEELGHKEYAFHWKNLKYALRCNIARSLVGQSFRKFSIRLADSDLLQWFTGINAFGYRKAASKSTLDRYSKMFDENMLETQIHQWQSSFLSVKKKQWASD